MFLFCQQAAPVHSDLGLAKVHVKNDGHCHRRLGQQVEYPLRLPVRQLRKVLFGKAVIGACTVSGTVVLLLVKSESYISVYDKVVVHGVFTLSRPISRQSLLLALGWMASARERLRKIEKKTLSIEDKMEEIRLVNRAKWLLISELKMDEPQAHRYIEKQAMDMCVSKRRVAEEIIRTYS